MDWCLPGFSDHGISQARMLEWVATSCSRGSSQPRSRTGVSSIADGFFTTEPPGKSLLLTRFYNLGLRYLNCSFHTLKWFLICLKESYKPISKHSVWERIKWDKVCARPPTVTSLWQLQWWEDGKMACRWEGGFLASHSDKHHELTLLTLFPTKPSIRILTLISI